MASVKKKPDGAPGLAKAEPSAPTPFASDDIDWAVIKPSAAPKADAPPLESEKLDETMRPPPLPPPAATRTYRVWAQGDLQRDGVTYGPGATIELSEGVAAGIPCLSLKE